MSCINSYKHARKPSIIPGSDYQIRKKIQNFYSVAIFDILTLLVDSPNIYMEKRYTLSLSVGLAVFAQNAFKISKADYLYMIVQIRQ